MEIEPGQAWEMYSAKERRWVRVVVAKVAPSFVTLRYQGLFEFVTVDLTEMENAERFRPAKGRP
jgi:hypothetical protein